MPARGGHTWVVGLEGRTVSYWIITLVIVAIALCIIAIVAVGMHGRVNAPSPEMSEVISTTVRHLNGDAPPPKAFVELGTEIESRRHRRQGAAN